MHPPGVRSRRRASTLERVAVGFTGVFEQTRFLIHDRLPFRAVQRIVDLYLACWCIAAVAIVAGFTLARATPPNWVLDLVLAGLVLALAGVIYGDRSRRQA